MYLSIYVHNIYIYIYRCVYIYIYIYTYPHIPFKRNCLFSEMYGSAVAFLTVPAACDKACTVHENPLENRISRNCMHPVHAGTT